MANDREYNIYVIELDSAVLEVKKFAGKNPNHDPRKPCVYVGSTVRTPEERFEQHKNGFKAARIVKKYGIRLRPRLYRNFNPVGCSGLDGGDDPCPEPLRTERRRAAQLRKKGYWVWQN